MQPRQPFQYRAPNREAMKARSEQQGGSFDNFIHDRFTTFTPKEGDVMIRIMPPTFEGAQHYGLDIFIHYNVGPDNQQYLCLDKMLGQPCPCCEAVRAAQRRSDTDFVKALAISKRVLAWVINRQEEAAGPLVYSMPWTLDRDFSALSIDKRTGEVLCIDDPVNGYDIDFKKTGKGVNTKYIGIAIARRSTPLHPQQQKMDDWLNFIMDNTLMDVLKFYSYDHIQKALNGPPKDKAPEVQTRAEQQAPPPPTEQRQPAVARPVVAERPRISDPSEPLDRPAPAQQPVARPVVEQQAPAPAPAPAASGADDIRARLRAKLGQK